MSSVADTPAAPITLTVYNRQGEATAQTVEIDPAEFGGKISKQLIHDVILMYQANKRAGTHSTLRRGEVAGSGKKLFRQKGTGNARAGGKRTNKRRGGGTAKGPKPRDYYYRMPKKAIRIATKMAILSRLQDNEVVLIDDLSFDAPKTKVMAGIMKALKIDGKTCLIGTAGQQDQVYRSARNIEGVEVAPAAEFNALTVLRPKKLLLTVACLAELRAIAKKKVSRRQSTTTEAAAPA